jgi:hypothetical protein
MSRDPQVVGLAWAGFEHGLPGRLAVVSLIATRT